MGRWLTIGAALLLVPAIRAAGSERWITVKSKFFTVITTVEEKTAQTWATELEVFRRGMQIARPVPEERLKPVTLILFPNEQAMRPFTVRENGSAVRLAGFFSQDLNVAAMILQGRDAKENRHTIYHEAAHWHSSAADVTLPLWLEEGTAEVYANFKINPAGECVFGEMDKGWVRALKSHGLVSLEKLLHAKTMPAGDREMTAYYYAQSWALAHYMSFGGATGSHRFLTRFTAEWRKSGDADKAFFAAFGKDVDAVEKDLWGYLKDGKYRVYRIPLDRASVAGSLVTAPAEPGEVDLALGTAMLATRGGDLAKPYLLRAKEARPEDPRPWAILGLVAAKEDNLTEAAESFRRGIALGSTNDWAYAGAAASCAQDDPDTAADMLVKAIALRPAHRDYYESLAGLIDRVSTVNVVQARVIARGGIRWPDSGRLQLGKAIILLRAGDPAAGRARIAALRAANALSTADARLADSVVAAEEWKAQTATFDDLVEHGRYDEAVAAADRMAESAPDAAARRQLRRARARADEYRQLNDAREAIRRGETEAARARLTDLVEKANEGLVRTAAGKMLAEIPVVAPGGAK